MIKKSQRPDADAGSPVRLVGVGAGGAALEQRLLAITDGPLADLLNPSDEAQSLPRSLEEVDAYDLAGLAILLVAVATDGTDAEVRAALSLVWRACVLDIRVMSILVRPRGGTPANPDLDEALADELVDGQIDVWADATDDELHALRWFYAGLRGVARDGELILEPGWDLVDVLEVLDLPGTRLTLATASVAKGVDITVAVSDALENLTFSGVDLDAASGILLVLWRAPDQKLYAQDVREAARIVGEALGQGSLHLTLTARSRVSWGDIGGCATVVTSTRLGFAPETIS